MTDKIIFLIQCYFAISITMSICLILCRFPQELRLAKRYKQNIEWDYLLKKFVILCICFPIMAMYYGLKEF